MKRTIVMLILASLLLSFPGCSAQSGESTISVTAPAAAVTESTVPAIVLPIPRTPEALAQTPAAEPVRIFSDKEKEILLKIGMAERGDTGCPECIALVMCTILNRVAAPKFGSTIAKVVLSPEQFTPVANGYYYKVNPNENCYDALEMVTYGWDESQGALYYEWCEGESWHSKNLELLFQHCDMRFYE